MKKLALLVALAFAFPLSAEEPQDAVFAKALGHVRQHFRGAPPAPKASPDEVAVAKQTIAGAPKTFRTFLSRHFAEVIAEGLAPGYAHTDIEIEADRAGGYAVLDLEQFEAGAQNYDWDRLNAKYPKIRHVVRLSWPTVDRLGSYAVVRYELIGRNGATWASFVKFERQNDGSWEAGVHSVGALWD